MTNRTLAAALVAIALAPGFAEARPVVKNLGGGLAEIASTEGRTKSLAADAKGPKVLAGRAGEVELSHPVVFDKAGRPLVRITFDGRRTTSEVLGDLSTIAVPAVSGSQTGSGSRTREPAWSVRSRRPAGAASARRSPVTSESRSGSCAHSRATKSARSAGGSSTARSNNSLARDQRSVDSLPAMAQL